MDAYTLLIDFGSVGWLLCFEGFEGKMDRWKDIPFSKEEEEGVVAAEE